MTLPLWGTVAFCAKCGTGRTYASARWTVVLGEDEKMCLECRCGYYWYERPRDYPSDPPPQDVEELAAAEVEAILRNESWDALERVSARRPTS